MGIVLVTGCSGSGKTSVAAELTRRGLVAVDADTALAMWLDRDGRPVELPDDTTFEWLSEHDWSWDLSLLDELAARPGTLYVCGNAGNVGKAWPRFDRAYLLVIDEATMLSRLDYPHRDHDFGRSPGQRAWLRDWRPRYQAEVAGLGAIPVDATQALNTVVDEITEQDQR
ncbi:ATP-binding protein [Actinokineospora terrae]|uniref:AAA domain-containing protein n=1 Tax=Actinokineospora terrae TaxID=155974 RepID=A0A1H9KE43_9PSEU|nr:ATP-binding protein [Actinokineospora terrae]SEQ97133.1 hypothetical protein SAMN04487818_101129 [Actinokineospora terrae]